MKYLLCCKIFTLAISKCYGKVRVLFFPRDNSLISRGNSHVSRVRGLVVRCLLFNPEVSCSNPWVCANFFTSIPKQKVLTFFGTMRLFGFVRLFWLCETFFSKFFKCPQRVLLSIFLIFCKRTIVKKSQRVPFFRIFGTMRLFKILIFFQKFFRLPYFFQKFFNDPKASSFQFFHILQQNECYKIRKGPFFTFFGTMRLAETSKKIEKVRIFFSQFLVLKNRFFKDRSFFFATFFKFVFTEAPAQFLQETQRFARGLLKALRLTGDHQKCFRKILKFFSSIFCSRFSVEKEWVFCCFQLGKNGFRGLRVSLRVFFGAVKLMKF